MSVPVKNIQAVIETLEAEAVIGQGSASSYDIGMMHAFKAAATLLRKVVNEHEAKSEPQEQVRSEKNDD